ncbi:MAG TPA: tetratricopeptide repeat protein [Nitrososphaeraceae archaeon]|nr:tetratricopeptide repeat protein [Nitrososphaeraceae archaeon]
MKLDNEHTLILPLVESKEDEICLPLALNVILTYWGEYNLVKEAKERARKYNNIKGSIFIEGFELAESRGYLVKIFRGNIKGLKKKIDQGIPSIVIMPGLKDTIQHATVISGYDPEENRIVTYVPEPDTVGSIPEKKFTELWEQDGSLTITIVPDDMKDVNDKESPHTDQSYRMCFEAERLLLTGKTKEAIEKLRNAADTNKGNELALDMLGSIYNELKSDEAKNYFEASIKVNPKFYLSYRGIGNYYLRKEEYSLAEKSYSSAISINPNRFGPIYKNRGIVRLKLDNKEGAISDLNMYLDQCPQANDKNNIELAIKDLLSKNP